MDYRRRGSESSSWDVVIHLTIFSVLPQESINMLPSQQLSHLHIYHHHEPVRELIRPVAECLQGLGVCVVMHIPVVVAPFHPCSLQIRFLQQNMFVTCKQHSQHVTLGV